jgi:chromosome partitioning protein
MNEIVAVINQKGGAGKTTTAHSLGARLMLDGHKVLFVDIDGQGNLSEALGTERGRYSVLDVLLKRISIQDAIEKTPNGDLVPSNKALFTADIIMTETGKEYRLKEALSEVKKKYDFIIVDTPPSLGILTINALSAADSAIITAQADIFSLCGIVQVSETIREVKRYCNPSLRVSGILLTRYNDHIIISRNIADNMQKTAKELSTKLFKTKIRENVSIREAQLRKQSIFTYASTSNGAIDYTEFTKEFLKEKKQS